MRLEKDGYFRSAIRSGRASAPLRSRGIGAGSGNRIAHVCDKTNVENADRRPSLASLAEKKIDTSRGDKFRGEGSNLLLSSCPRISPRIFILGKGERAGRRPRYWN